jgi:hypothetical protein
VSPPLPQNPQPEELAEGEELTVYRVVRTDQRGTPEFVDSFKSRAELGLPPRRNTPEAAHPLIHQGISVYERREAAIETARHIRRIGRDIGGYVAEMLIPSGVCVRYLRWGARGHLTLWAEPLMLSELSVDTIPID